MKKIDAFLKSIYLGDRYCEKIDIQKNKISLQVNCISRIEKGTDGWNYYSKGDIEHGYIIFDNVTKYVIDEDLLLNDEIYEIKVVSKNEEVFLFIIYGCNVSDDMVLTDVQLQIEAKNVYIFDEINNVFYFE